MTALYPLLQQELTSLLLESARIAGLVIVAPLAWVRAPQRVKVGLVLMLVMVVHGRAATEPLPGHVLGTAWAVGTEIGLGIAMGLVVRAVVAIAEVCGDAVSPLLGLGVAHMFDGSGSSSQVLLAAIFRYMVILLALLVGLHRVVLSELLCSFDVVPVGRVASPALAFPTVLGLTVRTIESGVRIGLPMLAILFMTQLALAFVARAAPQLQIFSVGFAVTLAVGLGVLILFLPDMARGFTGELSWVGPKIEELIGTLGKAP